MIWTAESNLTVIGLMSGTSCDGIDAALVSVEGSGPAARIHFRGSSTYPYPIAVRRRLLDLASLEPTDTREVSAMSFFLGGLLADAAVECALESGVDLSKVDVIGSHGHTICHQGTSADYLGARIASTLQIGEPAVIARRTGATVISDFRTADIAAGGQGAPLAPYFDFVFLRHGRLARAAQNIGGVANVTYLPAGCSMAEVVAFDTGPGNMLIDGAASLLTQGALTCDLDGRMALAGRVHQGLLDRLLAHPFYALRPPRSAGREQFGAQYLDEVLSWPEARALADVDVIATLTALTAESIARSYRDFLGPVDEIVLSGGGANNPALVSMVEQACAAKVVPFDELGIPGDAKEAVAFALLASETARGVPCNIPAATGASGPAILGKITPAPLHPGRQ